MDFPHPDSPYHSQCLPGTGWKFTSSTAWRVPLGLSKYFFRCSQCNISVFCSRICQSPFLSGSGCSGPGGFRLQSPSRMGLEHSGTAYLHLSQKTQPSGSLVGRASCRQWPEAASHRFPAGNGTKESFRVRVFLYPCIFPAGVLIPPLPCID